MSSARTMTRSMLVAVFVVALEACATGAGPSPVLPGAPASAISEATALEDAQTVAPATAGEADVQSPPEANLRVDGGDPINGQLGTYVWDGGGSDSPWLPGAPIQAASGEVLTVTLSPAVRMTDWSAVIAPAADGDGSGAVKVGSGPSALDVAAPGPGDWTLAVTIEFGDHGTATWFWRLQVS